MPTRPNWIAIAKRLNTRLKTLNAQLNQRSKSGWATKAQHIQTYGYLAALQEKLEAALGRSHTKSGKYNPGSTGGYPKVDVMQLAQLAIMALHYAGTGRGTPGLLKSVRAAIKK